MKNQTKGMETKNGFITWVYSILPVIPVFSVYNSLLYKNKPFIRRLFHEKAFLLFVFLSFFPDVLLIREIFPMKKPRKLPEVLTPSQELFPLTCITAVPCLQKKNRQVTILF